MNTDFLLAIGFFSVMFGSLAFFGIREYRLKKRIERETAMAKRKAHKERTNVGRHFKYEVYQDKKGEYRFRFKSNNGNIMAVSSEGYKHVADVLNAITRLKHSKVSAVIRLDTAEDDDRGNS